MCAHTSKLSLKLSLRVVLLHAECSSFALVHQGPLQPPSIFFSFLQLQVKFLKLVSGTQSSVLSLSYPFLPAALEADNPLASDLYPF